MPVKIRVPFKIWIPTVRETPYYKIEIIDLDNVTHTVTTDLLEANITYPTFRTGLFNFRIKLDNPNQKYLNLFEKGNTIQIYRDYTDATTLKLKGKIEDPLYGYSDGFNVTIFGRNHPELKDTKITVDFSTGVSVYNAIKSILDIYFTDLTYTNMDTDMTYVTHSKYENKSPRDIISDLLKQAGYDGYIDTSDDLHTFSEIGVTNNSESVTYNENLYSISNFGGDSQEESNKIQVIGREIEDCPIYKMKQDTTEQAKTWVKDIIINRSDVDTLDFADDVAEVEKDFRKTATQKGSVSVTGLAVLNPGDLVPFSVPDCNLVGNYFINEYSDIFTVDEGWKQTLRINKSPTLAETLLKVEIQTREQERNLNNPNGMTDTMILLTFNDEDDIDSLSNCHLANGNLILDSGVDTGTMISNMFEADDNFTEFEIRSKYNDDSDVCQFYASNDNGASYSEALRVSDLGDIHSLDSSGRLCRLKVVIKSDATNVTPKIDSVCLLIRR